MQYTFVLHCCDVMALCTASQISNKLLLESKGLKKRRAVRRLVGSLLTSVWYVETGFNRSGFMLQCKQLTQGSRECAANSQWGSDGLRRLYAREITGTNSTPVGRYSIELTVKMDWKLLTSMQPLPPTTATTGRYLRIFHNTTNLYSIGLNGL